MKCTETGCDHGTDNGHAIYRTNPYGEPFQGKCVRHFLGEIDPVVRAVAEAFSCEVEEGTDDTPVRLPGGGWGAPSF